MTNNESKILAALKKSKDAMRPGDIATVTGIDKADVSKALKNLKKEEKIESPKRCCWAAK